MVTTIPGGSSDCRDGGSTGDEEEEEEEVFMGDEEVGVIGMERNQINENVLILLLLSPK